MIAAVETVERGERSLGVGAHQAELDPVILVDVGGQGEDLRQHIIAVAGGAPDGEFGELAIVVVQARTAPDADRRGEVHELDFHQRPIGAVVEVDRLAAALVLDAQQQGGGRGHHGAAGLDDELGAGLAEIVFHGLSDGFEVVVHRRGFAGRVGGRIAAADVEALELDAGLFGDLGGGGDVALIGISIFALRADVEAEAGCVAHLIDEADDFGRAILHDPELDAEIIGLEGLAGLETRGDLDIAARRNHGGQLVELLGMVDGERAHAEFFVGPLDLALVLDGVVVVHDSAGRMFAHQFHLGVGGHIERLQALAVQLSDDVRGGVAFDRIGQQPIKAFPEDLDRLVELTFRKQKTREIRSFGSNQCRICFKT